jgi:hypothetical protein
MPKSKNQISHSEMGKVKIKMKSDRAKINKRLKFKNQRCKER